MRKRVILALSALLCFISLLDARTAEYVVKTVGFKVVQISMDFNLRDHYLKVKARSLNTTKVFPKIDNDYLITYTGDFLPIEYERQVRQDNANGRVLTRYNRDNNTATQIGETESETFSYETDPSSRDFFSFLGFLCEYRPESGSYKVDGNGAAWEAALDYQGSEKLRTPIGQFMTRKYEIHLKPLGRSRVPYVDMFTNNLFNQDTTIRIWISDQGIAVKAQVSKDLASTTWELLSFEK